MKARRSGDLRSRSARELPMRDGVRAGLLISVACAALVVAGAASTETLSQERPLSFGRIVLGQASGTVSVPPVGPASCSPHTCLDGQQSAMFTLDQGLPLTPYSVSFESDGLLLHGGGSGSATLENLRASGGGGVVTNLFGSGSFTVGADLVLGPSTVGGSYSGSYNVTVDFP